MTKMGIANLSLRRREPLFGLDIGHSSLKVMQLEPGNARNKSMSVVGYGNSYRYGAASIRDGEIVDQKALGDAMHDLFEKRLVGMISTRKVACTIPMSHSFSRPLKLPVMNEVDLAAAVQLEVEQYIPVPVDKLYIDFDEVRRDTKNIDLLVVASPKNIVDSYMKFLQSMGLEPVALEPTMNATARIFGLADSARDTPTVLVDFGANAIDIAVYDKTLIVNGTVQGGSNTMIDLIATKLRVSRDEAYRIKSQEGIGFSGHLRDIGQAVKPTLDNLIREIRKIIRYFNERVAVSGRKVSQVITIGGGADMPGLSEFLSKDLNLPVRLLNPWRQIDFDGLAPPGELERSMFITVAGEAIVDMSEITND